MVALPNVRPALTTGGLGGTALERIPFACRVGIGRRWFIQQPTQIDEMGLGGRTLFKFSRLPFGDELVGSHRGASLRFSER